MGHDITAFNVSNTELNQLAMTMLPEYIAHSTPLQFKHDLHEKVVVASFRRSAFDRYNKALYRALGTEDLYEEVSGKFGDRWFDVNELEMALASVDYLGADVDFAMTEEEVEELQTNVEAELQRQALTDPELREHLAQGHPDMIELGATIEDNLESEKVFLRTCIKYCKQHDKPRVRIFFG
jgi:hypothetical protein